MAIELTTLAHQQDFLKAIKKAFTGIRLSGTNETYANPLIDLSDPTIKDNIEDLWMGYEDLQAIPSQWRTRDEDGPLGIDIRMETGTGKTYCYTRLMYELNAMHGFHKFIILVPSTPIREGTRSFLEADYTKRHFGDLYPNKSLDLAVLESQKKVKGRKMFPSAVSEYVRGTAFEKNRFSVLLMTSGMLMSKATMAKSDYDQTLLGNFTQPYAALRSTRPIVIIDEPHRFKKENKAYQTLIQQIDPQCIIRFGATFPEKKKKGEKETDYNHLIFNLGATQAFNQNLVKGVDTHMIGAEQDNETKIKLVSFKRSPKICRFRDEANKKTRELVKGDNLSVFGSEFSGITVSEIGKTSDDHIKSGVTLSNGQVLAKGDMIYGGIYTQTYQEQMLEQSIINHLETEEENFLKENKIKTLTLYFIDSVQSYRGADGKSGHLRVKFEELLAQKLKEKIQSIDDHSDQRLLAYRDYLESSLADISKTNGGYFSEDNSTAEEDIKNEVDHILRDKDSLLSFKDQSGEWNTMRFIFSKWTLKEGWDNPNIFQIVKLRSSGSEISKLQEVGRGLRLPVDERGYRIDDKQFYLTYLVDYSEREFANQLIGEISADQADPVMNIKPLLSKISKLRGKAEKDIFATMLSEDFINYDGEIQADQRYRLYEEYPEVGELMPNKIINRSSKKKNHVGVRKDKFADIQKLWQQMNQKYYLKFDDIPDDELADAFYDILSSDIYRDTVMETRSQKTVTKDGQITLKSSVVHQQIVEDELPYGKFLKALNQRTGLPVTLIHQVICQYSQDHAGIDRRLFSKIAVTLIADHFKKWLDDKLLKRFSYRPLHVTVNETSLTDYKGDVVEKLPQGVLGIYRDDDEKLPEKFIYDAVVYDSPKEKETLLKSDIDEVVVFGKIPRRSVQIPLFTGGTTSPDFMYVIGSKDGSAEINFIVETKDVKGDQDLRRNEAFRMKSAEKFFETMKDEGIHVVFKKQLQNDDIVALIKGLNE